MTIESNDQEMPKGEMIDKFPEKSKAEIIRSGIEVRLAEVSNAIKAGHSSLVRLELESVGHRILALFDEVLNEIPKDWEKKPNMIRYEVSAEELERGVTIGDNRSERFWQIDSEIEALVKKFDELYDEQVDIPTGSFFIHPGKSSIH